MEPINVGAFTLHTRTTPGLGLVLVGATREPTPYLDPVFADATSREAFFQLVEQHGLVVAQDLTIAPDPYRKVGGKRSHGRMSQGEYYHHDGCSTPTRPRVVEIRCPPQQIVRTMGTSIAPFPGVVRAMFEQLPPALRRVDGLPDTLDDAPPDADWEALQGLLNRIVRQLDAEEARAWFHAVDTAVGAYTAPWTLHESRFMANENPTSTVQHRRACQVPWNPGVPNGHLLKRWPNEELPALTPGG